MRRFIALGAALLTALFLAGSSAAQTPEQFMEQAVYRHSFGEHTFRLPPKEFAFLVDNLVGVLTMASQPGFRRRHPEVQNLYLERLTGSPRDFTLGMAGQQARVRMQWLDDKKILYLAEVNLNKLGLSITGQFMALVELAYASPEAPGVRAKITVAFKPSSSVVGMALKPVMGAFDKEVDRIGQRALGLADQFIAVYASEQGGAFSRAGLLSEVAALNQQRQELASRAGAKPASPASAQHPVAWLAALAGGVMLLIIGLFLGRWWAGRRPEARRAGQLKILRRAQREQESQDRGLVRVLKRRGLSTAEAEAALAEHRRLSAELKQRVERAAAPQA
ncbi:MAG: hypothetical protein KQH53_12220 [Desulfarculaceae bacterium]|nr:hypothetical protein [Desulfarculaceae bacterium]